MREKLDFSGKVAVVTGGASGIGRGIANEFAKEGADVGIADIDDERGEMVAEEIQDEHGQEAVFVHTDISDYKKCGESVDEVLEELGKIDVLANVAAGGLGDMEGMTQPFIEETPENWAPHIEVTFRGPLNMTRQVLPHMKDRGKGAIVNFASDSYQGQDPNLTVYGAAKAGVVTFTQSLAKEVGEHGIRVNCISPSTTWTPASEEWLEEHGDKVAEQYPLGRLGQPEDHAYAALFLTSDAADWITGQVISVNGGFL